MKVLNSTFSAFLKIFKVTFELQPQSRELNLICWDTLETVKNSPTHFKCTAYVLKVCCGVSHQDISNRSLEFL